MSFEELKQQFIDNGFQVNGNSFILNQVSYSTMIINGVPHQQSQHHKFEMEYVFEGSICDVGDSEAEPLYQFDVVSKLIKIIKFIHIYHKNNKNIFHKYLYDNHKAEIQSK